jgi:hypothetical protein
LIRFFDTSALAKRYISEPVSQLVRATLRAHLVSVARITYAELAASIARAWRLAAITTIQRDAVMARLAGDFSKLRIVEIRPALVDLVPDLVLRHPLRSKLSSPEAVARMRRLRASTSWSSNSFAHGPDRA